MNCHVNRNIPTCLQLTTQQYTKLERFITFIGNVVSQEKQLNAMEEDCSMASSFIFTTYSTGIGDVIWCEAFGYRCDLSIGDDGELFKDEWIEK